MIFQATGGDLFILDGYISAATLPVFLNYSLSLIYQL